MAVQRRKCIAIAKSTKKRCTQWAVKGATVCWKHGAAAPQVANKAAVRAELADWGITDEKVDPGETLLRLLSQAARRANVYAAELQEKVEELGLEKATVGVAFGEGGAQGEYIRGLAQLESEERDRAANFARLALAAGIEERRVQMAERETSLLEDFLRAVLNDPQIGMSPEQRQAFIESARRHLTAA